LGRAGYADGRAVGTHHAPRALLLVSHGAVQFVVYEALKTKARPR
jgi:hypothetical protein